MMAIEVDKDLGIKNKKELRGVMPCHAFFFSFRATLGVERRQNQSMRSGKVVTPVRLTSRSIIHSTRTRIPCSIPHILRE
jgi:hypothetical protein